MNVIQYKRATAKHEGGKCTTLCEDHGVEGKRCIFIYRQETRSINVASEVLECDRGGVSDINRCGGVESESGESGISGIDTISIVACISSDECILGDSI